MPKFDPFNIDHIKAYRHLCDHAVWPENIDITERHESPIWVIVIQSKLAEAYTEKVLRGEVFGIPSHT